MTLRAGPSHLLAAVILAAQVFAACRPEQPTAPPIAPRPTDPSNSRFAYLAPEGELDASLSPDAGPILDASALPGFDVNPATPQPQP